MEKNISVVTEVWEMPDFNKVELIYLPQGC